MSLSFAGSIIPRQGIDGVLVLLSVTIFNLDNLPLWRCGCLITAGFFNFALQRLADVDQPLPTEPDKTLIDLACVVAFIVLSQQSLIPLLRLFQIPRQTVTPLLKAECQGSRRWQVVLLRRGGE